MSITAYTAIRWLKKLGFEWKEVQKGVYIDGYEKPDVVFYHQQDFLPKWHKLEN